MDDKKNPFGLGQPPPPKREDKAILHKKINLIYSTAFKPLFENRSSIIAKYFPKGLPENRPKNTPGSIPVAKLYDTIRAGINENLTGKIDSGIYYLGLYYDKAFAVLFDAHPTAFKNLLNVCRSDLNTFLLPSCNSLNHEQDIEELELRRLDCIRRVKSQSETLFPETEAFKILYNTYGETCISNPFDNALNHSHRFFELVLREAKLELSAKLLSKCYKHQDLSDNLDRLNNACATLKQKISDLEAKNIEHDERLIRLTNSNKDLLEMQKMLEDALLRRQDTDELKRKLMPDE